MAEERLAFQAEVSRLLEIVARSLYSQKEVFLRELISNASDACDRLRYAALAQPELTADDPAFRIRLEVDRGQRTLTVADNGIGMTRQELIDNLGTIARSGTRAFIDALATEARPDLSLIGQFGVGFYSAFMVAKQVEVLTRRAGEARGWRWVSDGKGSFTISEAEDVGRGTRVVLHLNDDEGEFLDEERLRHVVKTHSDHIGLPILLAGEKGEEKLNRAGALWTRPRSEITEADYAEFYRHIAHAFDAPWATLHIKAEGRLDYTALLFVPSAKPFDLFHPDRKPLVRLYVRRVFVTAEAEGFVPGYLRFLRGIVDSEDLPLNVSREMLQGSPLVAKIRQAIVKRVLAELGKKAADDKAAYESFWEQFGAVLKEGVYEDGEQREALLPLLRLRSSEAEGLTDLEGYVGRMKPGQDAIYYITGDDEAALRQSPQLEGFRARGVEVLLLTDPVDEFWLPALANYKDKPFKSVTRLGADLSKIPLKEGAAAPAPAAPAGDIERLVTAFRELLKDQVKDVRASDRLTDSPVCLVAGEGDLDLHLERLLKQHRQVEAAAKRVLEVNPTHPLIRRLTALSADDAGRQQLGELALLLLDQARILEGEALPDPAGFARRLALALERGLPMAA